MKAIVEALPDFCSDCERRRECLGCCKAAGEACYGSVRALEPFVERHRERVRKPG